MLVKLHRSYRTVVAVCDSDLVGKTFEEGKKHLAVRESFYKGDEMQEPELIRLMQREAREDATFNIVGKDSIAAALKAGIIEEEQVSSIQGIVFALTLL